MIDENIVQITSTNGMVYGLTSSGQLAVFDSNVGKWVLRCQAEILTAGGVNKLQKEAPIYLEPQGRYRNPTIEQKPSRRRFKMIDPVNVAIGLVALALLLYWFVK